MKIRIHFFIILIFNCIIAFGQSELQTKIYQYDVGDFYNPERGLVKQSSIRYSGGTNYANSGLTRSYIENNLLNKNISIIWRYYGLQDWHNKPIPEDFLQILNNDLNICRETGIKIIPRFIYSSSISTNPVDADINQVMAHLDQIEPIFKNNADVILTWQAGFIGAWGEWAYSDFYGATGITYKEDSLHMSKRRKIIQRLLEIMPESRTISIRYPRDKQGCTYPYLSVPSDTLTKSMAFSGDYKARVGYYNDSYLYDDSDRGTYIPSNQIWQMREYVIGDSKYLPFGGETSGFVTDKYYKPSEVFKWCDLFNLSYLHDIYHPDVVNYWKQNNVWDSLVLRLGYRFYLKEGSYSPSLKIGENFQFKFIVENLGFTTPFNPRDCELVFIGNGKTIRKKINTDPRHWREGTTVVEGNILIDNQFSAGAYDIYLNLPDPEPTLNTDPRYSIRLANKNAWNSSNGYNNLNFTVDVSENSGNQSPVINNKTASVLDNVANGSPVTTLSASDPDAGQTLTYAITAGNTNNAFNINNSGQIKVNNVSALPAVNSCSLTVRVTDDGSPPLSATATVTIQVTHINDPPVINNKQTSISDELSNGTLVTTVSASDPDAGQTLTFAITGGNNNTAFTIDNTGKIKVNNTNALKTNDVFNLTVQATDNGSPVLSGTGTVTININHINDPPVVQDKQVDISDDIPANTIVATLTASDPDPGQKLTFSITSGNTGNAFYIDNSGNLKVNNPSSLKQNHGFQLIVNVSDNGNPVLSADAALNISVNHVNDPPVVNNQQVTISDQLSNGSFVMQVNASDPDVDQSLNYTLVSGNQNNAFTLDHSGRLSVNNNQALTSVNLFQLIVEVSDNGSPGMTSGATMSIYIDHNVHNQPVIPVAPENMNGLVNGQKILLSWTDKSSNEDNFVVQRKLNTGSFENLTTLDANTTSFTDESVNDGNSYNYRVYARNEAGNSVVSNVYSIEYTDTSLYMLKGPSKLEYTLIEETVELTWDDISNNESGFILEKKNLLTNDVSIDTLPPNVTAYTDQNTMYSDELEYRISNFNKLFQSAYSNTVYVNIAEPIDPINIEIPTGFNGLSFHSDSVYFSWTYENQPGISFLIEKTDPAQQNTTLIEVSGSLRNHVDKHIDALSTYHYRIAATDGTDTSLFSSYITITTGETKNPFNAKAPEIRGYDLQNNVVDLFFDDQHQGEEYVIERSISDTMNFFQIGNIPVEQGMYSDNLLFRDLFIYYRIKSKVDNFESPYSNILKVINPTAYNEYDFIADATLTSDQEYELTWNEIPGCTHYRIERKLYGEQDFSTIETNIKSLQYPAYFPFGDIGGVTYMITACYDTLPLLTSNTVTIDDAFIKGYDQFQATNHINASVLLSWNSEMISEGSKIILYRSDEDVHNFKVVSSTFDNQYLDTTLEANKTYSYYIEYYVNEGRMKVTSDIETITTNESFQLVQPIIQNIETEVNRVSFAWSDSSTYSKMYVVKRSSTPDEGYQPVSALSEDSFFIDESVEPGKSYYYRVQVVIESVWNVYSPVELIYVPSENEAERSHEGMVAGYNFYNGGVEIQDVSNFGDPLNLVETDNNNPKIGKEKQQPVYTSVYAADKILESVKLSGAFSMECWIKPLDTKTSGLQQIVSIENNSGRLFGLYQDNGTGSGIHDYLINFRTGSTNEIGKPDLRVNKAYDYHAVHHIVYSRNADGKEKIYMDGKLLNSNVRPSNINDWLGKYHLIVAGKPDGTPSWKGNIYYLAIYNTVMDPEHIEKNYQAGPYKGFHNEVTDITIRVYPNPAREYVKVHLTPVSDFMSGERIKLMIINQTGIMMHQQVITDPSYEQIIELKLDEFKPGIYMVYVMGDGWKKTKRMVVNK